MAIAPNTTFVSGAILTAAQQNAFPFGNVALASSSTSYTLTTSVAVSTGMTVTFTAIASRNYKISYYEPVCQITPVISGSTTLQIRQTNAAGTLLQQCFGVNTTAVQGTVQMLCQYIGTFSAGSVTIVGCSTTSSTTGSPGLTRGATFQAQILVEDLGPA